MLWAVVIGLVLLWALGLITSYTFGGLIHVLLLVALVAIVIRGLQAARLTA